MRGGFKRIAWILAFLLGTPLAGLGLSHVARWTAELEFREQMEGVVPPGARARVQTMPLAELCATPGAETDAACSSHAPAVVLRQASIVVASAGLILLASIIGAGVAARVDRALLVALFQPGLRLAVAATVGLIVLHTLLAFVFVFVLLGLSTHKPPIFVLGPALIGAVYGAIALLRSLRGAVERVRTDVVGEEMPRATAPALWRLVDDVAARMGALRPDRIVAGLGTAFFVTEAEVGTPTGVLTGRTLCVSLPMASILTVAEFQAIVGHELGHFRGDDTAYSRLFAPIYRGTEAAIGALQSSARGGQLIVLLPAFAVLGVFLDAFARAERHHSRARELLADAAGAETESARTLASALVKTHAFAPCWGAAAISAQVDAVAGQKGAANLVVLFLKIARSAATTDRLHAIDQLRTTHPTDTHPTLASRLEALGLDIAAVATEALNLDPTVPAAWLVPDVVAVEERLTAIYRRGLAPVRMAMPQAG